MRFLAASDFSESTDLIVWRDSGRVVSPFSCGHPPSWYPLVVSGYVAFDEEEHADGRTIVVFSDGEDHVGSWTSAIDRLRAGG